MTHRRRASCSTSVAFDGQPLLAFGVRDLPRDVVEQVARTHRSPHQWHAFFSVHVENERAAPILGDYRAIDGVLWLVPSFPPERGVRYVAVFQPAALEGETAAAVDLPPEPVRAYLEVADRTTAPPATRVSGVHPSTSEIPENLLRFYVHFTAPMSRGEVLRWVRLEDSTGEPIEAAFLALGEELWDRHATRLTVLLDPGRIKSGLRPRAELGRALAKGDQVTIAIDGRWPDASGRPLAEGLRRSFRVVAADLAPPDPVLWRLEPPLAGGRAPLRIALGEPLDHALLKRLVWVEDEAGQRLAGSIALGDDERTWSFTPARALERGSLRGVDRSTARGPRRQPGRARVRGGPHARTERGVPDDRRSTGRRGAASLALDRRAVSAFKSHWPGAPACAPSGPSRAAPPCCARPGGTRTGTGSPPREDPECAPGSRAGS